MMADTPRDRPAGENSPGIWNRFKASIPDSVGLINRATSVTGRPRQVVLGSLLGTCLVFLVAMLGVSRLDAPLSVALYAFVSAIPLLGSALAIVSFVFGPGLNKRDELVTTSLKVASWLIGELLGTLAVFVGIVAVIWHLDPRAVLVGVIVLVLGALAFIVVAYYVGRQGMREMQERKDAPDADATGTTRDSAQ